MKVKQIRIENPMGLRIKKREWVKHYWVRDGDIMNKIMRIKD
jgi:hypothetical protein